MWRKKLHLGPQMNHSKGRTLKHALWPNLYMNPEDQSPVEGNEYRQIGWTFSSSSSWWMPRGGKEIKQKNLPVSCPHVHHHFCQSFLLSSTLIIPIFILTFYFIHIYPAEPLLISRAHVITMHRNGQPMLNSLLNLFCVQPAAHFPFVHHTPCLPFLIWSSSQT